VVGLKTDRFPEPTADHDVADLQIPLDLKDLGRFTDRNDR
jgi:hypothetical protein